MKAFLLLVYICFYSVLAGGQGHALPKSVAVISGYPLTIPDTQLQDYNMTPQQNTGGWGDVMANVSSAIEMKEKFPSISVRLIVTLNEIDPREFENKTKNIVLKSMAGPNGEVVLNPDLKTVQYYKGVEVYFVNLPIDLYGQPAKPRSKNELEAIENATLHIPESEVGVQYSANDHPVIPKIAKIQNLFLYFSEYGEQRTDFQQILPNESPIWMKMHSGPLNFGLYGFGANNPALNKKVIQSYVNRMGIQNFNFSSAEIAYAYAGDQTLIDDYVTAIKSLAKKNSGTPYFIFTKGNGPISVERNVTMIPLGQHPRELAHALIAQSTYSPLVTGDGSLSSALASTSIRGRPKTFLYELVFWKTNMLFTMFHNIFGQGEMATLAESLYFQELTNKEDTKLRKERVKNIVKALELSDVHSHIHQFLRKDPQRFDLIDNTVNIFQLQKLIQNFKKSSVLANDVYLTWLLKLTKKTHASDGWIQVFQNEILNSSVKNNSMKLVDVWFSLAALWALDAPVSDALVEKAVNDWNLVLERKNIDKMYIIRDAILNVLEFIRVTPGAREKVIEISKQNAEFGKNLLGLKEEFEIRFEIAPVKRCETHFR